MGNHLVAMQKAKKAVKEARGHDEVKNYSAAIELYERGIRYYKYCITYEAETPKQQEKMERKCIQIAERVAQIRYVLQMGLDDAESSPWQEYKTWENKEDFEKAMDLVTKAEYHENVAGDYEEALRYYNFAFQYFSDANDKLDSDGDDAKRATILKYYDKFERFKRFVEGTRAPDEDLPKQRINPDNAKRLRNLYSVLTGDNLKAVELFSDSWDKRVPYEKALILVAKAKDQETTHRDYAYARRLYFYALEYFLHVNRYEDYGSESVTIKQECLDCFTKLKELKQHVDDASSETASKGNLVEDDDVEEKVQATILAEQPDVMWNEVFGLDNAKEVLQEAFILPAKFPELFTGARKPWKAVLLYGPSGCGKSHLAKALATEAQNSTCFVISSTHLISKWLGESERFLKALFEQAREKAPSIIFIDQIDSIFHAPNKTESESSKRVRTEFALLLEDLGHNNKGVLVLGATNLPWVVDSSIWRRFEKRVLVPCPEKSARVDIFKHLFADVPNLLCDSNFDQLGDKTDGYSGSDIGVIVQEALMMPLRKIQAAKFFRKVRGRSPGDQDTIVEDLWTPCSADAPEAEEKDWTLIPGDKFQEPAITMDDVLTAISSVKPTITKDDWTNLDTFMKNAG